MKRSSLGFENLKMGNILQLCLASHQRLTSPCTCKGRSALQCKVGFISIHNGDSLFLYKLNLYQRTNQLSWVLTDMMTHERAVCAELGLGLVAPSLEGLRRVKDGLTVGDSERGTIT